MTHCSVRSGLFAALLASALAAPLAASAAEAAAPAVRKVFLPPRLQLGNTGILPVQPIDGAAWIWHPDWGKLPAKFRGEVFSAGWRGPVFLRFRRTFEASAEPLVIHVSADERFELFLDGQRIARGPDRGDVDHWSYATYEIAAAPGPHRLEALAWSIGPYAPVAQITFRGGFILKAEGAYDAALTTGRAAWEVAELDGFSLAPPHEGSIFGVGGEFTARGCGPQWKEGPDVAATVVRSALHPNPYGETAPGRRLCPSTLPDQTDREIVAGRVLGFAIVGTATNGHQAILKAFALRAEVMLMDHRMPGVNGIEATLFIKQFQNAPLVIMVTSDYSSAYRARAKAAGADGFVDKGGDIRSQLHNLFHDQFRSRREPLEPV